MSVNFNETERCKMPISSKINDTDWKYSQTAFLRNGWMNARGASQHRIYWEEYGSQSGEPVLFVHGGPGGACAPVLSRFFDPERYRVILFDQRGCGKSKPSASAENPLPALTENSTDHLITDMVQLRNELNIQGKMHLFGGSWGSTLAMAYAFKHPETVQTLILRGIFLCRKKDIDYFYQGNAVDYAENAYDAFLPGAYIFYPEAWRQFVEVISVGDRKDMVKAYAEIFATEPTSDAERARQTEAAKAWSMWEGSTSYLAQDLSDLGKFTRVDFARAFAKIENHYFMNGAFLGGCGESNRDNNYILANVGMIKDIPIHIVHGRYDQVCPIFQAEELVATLRQAGAVHIDYRLTVAGHSMLERENCQALTEIMDTLPRMSA